MIIMQKKRNRRNTTLFFCLAVSLFMENKYFIFQLRSLQTNLTSSYWCVEMLSKHWTLIEEEKKSNIYKYIFCPYYSDDNQ